MSKYWEKRQAEKMLGVMDKADISAKYLEELYAKSSLYLNSKIQGIFDKYRRTHGALTEREAKSLLNTLVDKTSYDELLLKLKNGAKNDERKELLKVLDAPAYRHRIQRLQDNHNELDSLMANVYNTEKKINTLTYIDVAFDSYYKDIYNIQKNIGYGFQFDKLDALSVDEMIKSKWIGSNYSERIWNNTDRLSQNLKEEMILNLLTGKSEKDMATTITERFMVGVYQAKRLIETEVAYITNYIDQQVFEECGIEKERFSAMHDLKTSKICQRHDGNIVECGKGIEGETIPPLHPHCRSFMDPIISKEVSDSLMRRERDIVTGKDRIVPANETYSEWLERQQRSNGVDTIDRLQTKYSHLSTDKQQYNRYVNVIGREKMPISLDKFQDLKYNEDSKFNDLKKFYHYKKSNPESDYSFFKINEELHDLGLIRGAAKAEKPQLINPYILKDVNAKREPAHILERMMQRNITSDQVKDFVANAKVMVLQRGGARRAYYSDSGVTVVSKQDDDTWLAKTVWDKTDFDDKVLEILEVTNKYGKED